MTTLRHAIRRFRHHVIRRDLIVFGWQVYAWTLGLALTLLIIEQLYYFSSATRTAIIIFTITVLVLIILSFLAFLLALRLNRLSAYRFITVARQIGEKTFSKPDTVLNALQLEKDLAHSQAAELSQLSIGRVEERLATLSPDDLFPLSSTRPWKQTVLTLLIILAGWFIFSGEEGAAAVYRWSHPGRDFPVPTPFVLRNETGDIHLLGGEMATIHIRPEGQMPDSVWLHLESLDSTGHLILSSTGDDSGRYHFQIKDVYNDYTYRAFVPSRHVWQAWDSVTTAPYHIQVTNRPLIEDFRLTVTPPAYARLEATVYSGNNANVQALAGSQITVFFRSNRPLQSARYRLNDKQMPLTLAGQSASAQFRLLHPGMFTLHFTDRRGVENRDPIPYHIQIIPDVPPSLTVLAPEKTVDLGDELLLSLALDIEDDFGFSSLQIGYEVRRPAYLNTDPYISVLAIPIPDRYQLNQSISTFWDLSNLGLMPEDEVHYHFELYDNDDVNGPKKFVSETFVARLPSLADLYTALEEGETDMMDAGLLSQDAIQALQDGVEELQLELLKSETLDWEKQQAVQSLVNETQTEMEKLAALSEQLADMRELGEKHGLFNSDLLEKLQQLQDLVQDLLSDELLQNLAAVQEALESMNLEEMQSALEALSQTMDQMENTIDRYLDIFKRIQAEQKLDEVVKRLEKLTEQQQRLDEEISDLTAASESGDYARLEQAEEWNRDELERIADNMTAAADALQDYSPAAADDMKEMADSPALEGAKANLSQAQSSLGQQNQEAAQSASEQSLENLARLQQQLAALQQQFQQSTGQAMAQEFQHILRNVLSVSKDQEALGNTTRTIPRTSPRLHQLASQQQTIRDQLTHIMSSLMELSRQTFAVTPDMGKQVGSAFAAMEDAKQLLAERNLTPARQRQAAALQGLNEVALALFQTAQNMQSGASSASGYEQFMEQMQAMANQQQGINQQGLQLGLGQMSASMEQALMQRLLAQQKQLRKSLQQLRQEMQASGTQSLGDLSGIAQEMDQVIRDLAQGRYTRKTKQRQEKILSRMLDSQKALSQRGKKEERKSVTAGDYLPYAGPGGLPVDRGQRRSLSLEALNRSLKAGYSSDYQDMIRRYFNRLAETEMNRQPAAKEGDHDVP
ncbi:MAG: DUF4175 family protein [Fidelibacterota bacterium]